MVNRAGEFLIKANRIFHLWGDTIRTSSPWLDPGVLIYSDVVASAGSRVKEISGRLIAGVPVSKLEEGRREAGDPSARSTLGLNDQRGRGCILAGRRNDEKKTRTSREKESKREGKKERERESRQITLDVKKREVGAE